jgi:hypothetical protein
MVLIHTFLSGMISLFLENPLWQLLWFIAVLIGVCWYIVTNDTQTIKIFIISCIFWILHFLYLENYWALWATFIGLLRLILSLKYKKNISVFMGIIALSIAAGIYSFNWQAVAMLPLIATSISSYGFFFLEKVKLRILLAGVSLIWLFYHIQTGSISWVLNETIVQCTIIYSIYKFMIWAEKKEKILIRLKRKIWKSPVRIDFWRFIFMRDNNRFK